VPPPAALLFFADANGRPCKPEEAYMWSWERGPGWFYAREHPVPACVSSLRADRRTRCAGCASGESRLSWTQFKNRTMHLRRAGAGGGGSGGYVNPPPAIDGGRAGEEDRYNQLPGVTGLEQQEDVAPEPDGRGRRAAVESKQRLMIVRTEGDTGTHGSIPQ